MLRSLSSAAALPRGEEEKEAKAEKQLALVCHLTDGFYPPSNECQIGILQSSDNSIR